jgi:3'-phosphoadenosine 5'-phosphosulfate sulfotransferase (PAPS reductase)/FAD synthetase
MNPFLMTENTIISFSGGRTSAYMLWKILEAHQNTLPAHVQVVFCNTGKERPETLDFVERCSLEWNVPIVWLEFQQKKFPAYTIVHYATASRQGEPFDALIRRQQGLPNVVMRFCTQWLKIKTSNHYVRHGLGWKYYQNAVGLRHDEPRRVAKLKADPKFCPGEEPFAPLALAKIELPEIMDFWASHSFDLCLLPHEGNCDGCFLKGQGKLVEIFRQRPDLAEWWIDKEQQFRGKTKKFSAARFRKDAPSYRATLEMAQSQQVFHWYDQEMPSCRCTD